MVICLLSSLFWVSWVAGLNWMCSKPFAHSCWCSPWRIRRFSPTKHETLSHLHGRNCDNSLLIRILSSWCPKKKVSGPRESQRSATIQPGIIAADWFLAAGGAQLTSILYNTWPIYSPWYGGDSSATTHVFLTFRAPVITLFASSADLLCKGEMTNARTLAVQHDSSFVNIERYTASCAGSHWYVQIDV